MKKYKILLKLLFIINILILNNCSNSILEPKGQIGFEERSLIFNAFLLMLIVVLPVIILTLLFSFKFNKNKNSKYNPKFLHSNLIEIMIWSVPIIIIFILGFITYKSTFKLEPNKKIYSSYIEPITIEVISLDWKWLFIYPKEGIATINEIIFPIHTPIKFKITSNSVMNSFFIPALGSQIYAMPGMKTELNLIANYTGTYNGISANFSGKGFSSMKFKVIAVKKTSDFQSWISGVKKNSKNLNINLKKVLEPSENNKIEYFQCNNCKVFYQIINNFKK